MGVTLLVLAIIAIVVGVSVKEYLQNKELQEAKEKQTEQIITPTPEPVRLTSSDVEVLLTEVEKIAETQVAEQVKKPKKKNYYKPKGKKQPKKQTNK